MKETKTDQEWIEEVKKITDPGEMLECLTENVGYFGEDPLYKEFRDVLLTQANVVSAGMERTPPAKAAHWMKCPKAYDPTKTLMVAEIKGVFLATLTIDETKDDKNKASCLTELRDGMQLYRRLDGTVESVTEFFQTNYAAAIKEALDG